MNTKTENAVKTANTLVARVISALENNEDLRWDSPCLVNSWRRLHNVTTGHFYKGLVNSIILGFEVMRTGDPRFIGAKAVRKMGGYMRKGTHWTWIWLPNISKDENGETKFNGFYQAPVVNVKDTQNIIGRAKDFTGRIIGENPPEDETGEAKGTIDNFQTFVSGIKHDVREIQTDIPFYMPEGDYIGMPKVERFRNDFVMTEAYAHELIHWTGHKSRLDRDLGGMGKGIVKYSREELTACLGSTWLLAGLGIELDTAQIDRQAAYLKNWVGHLKNDPIMLVEAMSTAGASVKWLEDERSGKHAKA